jgi:hypothetical protein
VESVGRAGLPQIEFKLTEFFYMLLFPFGCSWMMLTEEMGYPEWNLLKSWATLHGIQTTAFYLLLLLLGRPPDEAYRGYGLPWMESKFKPRTAVLD